LRHVSLESLAAGGEALLQAHGATPETARVILDVTLTAEARGHASHGLLRLPPLVRSIDQGLQAPKARPTIEERGAACLLADGQSSPGSFAAATIMEAVIDRTRRHGLCLASAHNINHFGIGAYYTDMAAREGLIGLALCNARPAAAVHGGIRAVIGTNPIAFSCPSGGEHPITLDMATTAVARGKLKACKLQGTPLPRDVAAGPDGVMTTDPDQGLAGFLLPLGGRFGFKGSGLAIMVDILSGALSGMATTTRVVGIQDGKRSTAGFFFLAIDPAFFCGREAFVAEVARMAADLKASGPDVLLPGERAHRREARARREGLDVAEELAESLNALAAASGLPPIVTMG
jgi:L-2-hydroxycarboxylate dehydrogenase (NAD+)